MYDSATSAENTPGRWGAHVHPSRFHTGIYLCLAVIWSIGLIGKTINHPSRTLIFASIVFVVLAIPMVSYTALRMSSNPRLRESWIGRRTIPSWIGEVTSLVVAVFLVCLLGDWVAPSVTEWGIWSDIAFPFLWLFISFGDTKLPDSEDVADTRTRWAFAYELGRRTGSYF